MFWWLPRSPNCYLPLEGFLGLKWVANGPSHSSTPQRLTEDVFTASAISCTASMRNEYYILSVISSEHCSHANTLLVFWARRWGKRTSIVLSSFRQARNTAASSSWGRASPIASQLRARSINSMATVWPSVSASTFGWRWAIICRLGLLGPWKRLLPHALSSWPCTSARPIHLSGTHFRGVLSLPHPLFLSSCRPLLPGRPLRTLQGHEEDWNDPPLHRLAAAVWNAGQQLVISLEYLGYRSVHSQFAGAAALPACSLDSFLALDCGLSAFIPLLADSFGYRGCRTMHRQVVGAVALPTVSLYRNRPLHEASPASFWCS